ncbi:MAG: ABC transporter permease [Phycisphaerales bacterium]
MIRMLHVAYREFASTAYTKSFMFGFFVMPIIMFVGIIGATALLNKEGPKVQGTVAVIDQSPGQTVAEGLRKRFSPEQQAKDAAERAEQVKKVVGASPVGAMAENDPQMQAALKAATLQTDIRLEVLAPDSDVKKEEERIWQDAASKDASPEAQGGKRLALVVVPPEAVVKKDDGTYGTQKLSIRQKLDIQLQNNIDRKVGESIVDARLDAAGFGAERERIRAMIRRPTVEAEEVTAQGNKKGLGGIGIIMPMAFMMLLWISVFTAGQYLLTTTIEEKSSRVMEVLLSAVSSRQLLIGKILGQMCVGLLVLGLYAGLGVGSLFFTKLIHIIDLTNLIYMGVFFLIAYALVACMMAAIGSAVSDMREAQALMTPVMLVLIVPMVLWMPISRDPNGMFATIASMTPPISPFVMVLRIPAAAGSIPVPAWQIALSIGLGIASVVFVAWAAAKIFRVGVLMYGKPPNLGTLIKWVRMA